MENWELIELNEDADAKAREELAEEMLQIGVHDAVVIWTDEGMARLDTFDKDTYRKVAQHLNVVYDGDPEAVNDALMKEYEDLYDIAHANLAKERGFL